MMLKKHSLCALTLDMLGLTDAESNLKYGAIQAFVYAFTFIGGIFADRILGFKKSLIFGGLVMVAGNLLIATDPHQFFHNIVLFFKLSYYSMNKLNSLLKIALHFYLLLILNVQLHFHALINKFHFQLVHLKILLLVKNSL